MTSNISLERRRYLVLRSDDLRAKGKSGCGSNTFLDLDLLVNRGIGWVGWKYQSGWVEWEFDWNAFASWYEAENFKEPSGRRYNGSGQLIYRGAVMNTIGRFRASG